MGQPKKGTKRAAADQKPQISQQDLTATVSALRIPELAARNQLKTLKVDDLKLYLGFHGLSKTGKKDDLIARVEGHINSPK